MRIRSLITHLCLWLMVSLAPGAETITTDIFDYRITYHPDLDSSNAEFVKDAQAQSVADFYDPSSGTGLHQTYIDLGFRAPEFTNIFGPIKPHILLENAPLTHGRSNTLFPDRIVLVPDNFVTGFSDTSAKALCGHELGHIVQYQYIPWGLDFLDLYPIGIEGTAATMEDCLGTDVDSASTVWFGNQADNYLESDSLDYFWGGSGYHACLFWKYVMEQYGTARSEPGLGVDVIERFYALGKAHHEDGMTTLIQRLLDERNRYTTSASDPGVELRDIWQDFSIANRLDGLGLTVHDSTVNRSITVADPGRFQYVDNVVNDESRLDIDKGVPLSWNGALYATGNSGMLTGSAPRWGASYLQCTFAPPPSGAYGIGFFAQSQDSSKVWYSLAAERASGAIDVVSKGSVHPDEDNTFQFATMQNASDPYVKLHVITNGEDGPSPVSGFSFTGVGFDFNFSYFQPTLSIVEPTADYKAYVGAAAAPDRFIAKVRVTSPDELGGGYVTGLTREMFTVYVDSAIAANQAPVLSAAYVMGEYWLTCQAPVKSPAPTTSQSIIVKLGTVTAAEEDAIVYDFLKVDQMLVIDKSGSMATTSGGIARVDAARAAAQLFIDASGSDDQIGVATFSGDKSAEPDGYADGKVVYPLQTMNSQLERDLVNLLIDETNPSDPLVPNGYTSIGDGLYHGASEIVANGMPEAEKWIILLSDGHQNEDSDWDAQRAFIQGTGIHVESIALGSGCDKNLLQTIATESSGRFYEVGAPDDPPPSASARTASSSSSSSRSSSSSLSPSSSVSGGSLPMILDLANEFLLTSERIHRRERIVEASSSLASGASTSRSLTLTEGGLTDCVVTVFCDQTSGIGLTITRPDGSTEPAPSTGSSSWNPDRYVTYRLPSMSDGTWGFSISNKGSSTAQYLFVLSGRNRQGAQSRVYFTQFHQNSTIYGQNGLYLRGLPMPVVAVLTDGNGPIRGAAVTATIVHPNRAPVTVLLRDDGCGYDGASNDGVYAGLYRATTEASFSGQSFAEETPPTITPSYHVIVNSTGKDNLGRNFQRVTRGAFHVYETEQGGDTDGDGMPDRYEQLHAGLNPSVNDAVGDGDRDGLSNLQEYQLGTDPGLADTDGGGETDGSEVAHSSNPWDYHDDAVPHALVARVLDRWGDVKPPPGYSSWMPAANQNLVTFSVERGFKNVRLYRSTSLTGPYSLVTTIDTTVTGGIYPDTGLTNGTTYYYYIQPLDATGREGTPSVVFSGTPHSNPNPPEGSLSINGGSRYTTSTNVTLRFAVSTVTHMKLAMTPSALEAAAWTPFTNVVPSFPMGASTSGLQCTVYALVKDSSGNETPLSANITYIDPGSAATITGTVVTPLDTSNRKASVIVKSGSVSVEISTPPSGAFSVPVPPGAGSITISQRGYQSFTMNSITLTAGTTLNLGTVTLTPLDSDADGLTDVDELLNEGTDRYRVDSDGDGYGDGVEVTVFMTNPTDPNSLLRMSSPPVVDRSTGMVTITFQSVAGVTYQFDYSSNLGTWSRVLESAVPKSVTATGTSTTTTLSFPPGTSARFFRVVVP